MKTISVREMKAHWAEVERHVRDGDTFEVLNRGRPSVRIVPAHPRRVLAWDDHLASAIRASGRRGEAAVKADREGRW
jgi:prevent-host-death family protein